MTRPAKSAARVTVRRPARTGHPATPGEQPFAPTSVVCDDHVKGNVAAAKAASEPHRCDPNTCLANGHWIKGVLAQNFDPSHTASLCTGRMHRHTVSPCSWARSGVMQHVMSRLTCRVFCPESGNCGSSCNEYQDGNAVKTQCTSADTWPSHMCSLKVTADSDGGDTTGVGGWIAEKLREP